MEVHFGEKIRAGRKAAGLTQRQLAQQLGVANTSISNWEKDLSRPDPDMIRRLCEILGLSPNDFYGTGEGHSAPSQPGKQITDDVIKFALFGGDGEITDAMYDEVKRFAAFIRERERHKE